MDLDAQTMAEAMKAMGWDPNAEVPMANEENTILLKEIKELTDKRSQLKEDLKDAEKRIKKVAKHSKIAKTALGHNLKLLAAHVTENMEEINRIKVVDREYSKLQEDIKDQDKQLECYKEFVASTDHELCKRNHRINAMTNRIKWAKTALVEWHKAMEDGNKGYQLIERYFKEDETLARQQNQRRQMLQDQIDKIRNKLVLMYDGRKTLEQNLECTAKLYRAAHTERRQLVDMWKTAVQQMTQREKEVIAGDNHLIELQAVSKKKEQVRLRYDQKLNTIIENNRQVEQAIEELNTDTSEIKEQTQILADMIVLKENEIDLLQKDLQNLSNRVQQQRAENRLNEKYKLGKETELHNCEQMLHNLEERLAAMESKTISSQQRMQMLEDLIDTETKAQNTISNETVRVNNLLFRTQQQLIKDRDEQKTIEMAEQGVTAAIIAIQRNTQKNEAILSRQVAIHYELGFKCLQIERRIIVMQGGVLDPEAERRNLDYLDELEELMKQATKRLAITETQNRKLNDNMRQLTIIFNEDNKKLDVCHYNIKEAQAYCDGGIVRCKDQTQKNQALIVDLSVLRMRANQFELVLSSCEKSAYNLERHRMQLNRTMKDRMVEIKSQMELLNCKRKTLHEERATMKADIGERNKQITAVRARFELTSKLLGTNEDGTLVTSTQLKVEMAQEKQLLLDEGNELNEKVLKAEKEIKAMENTMVFFNMSNNGYRMQFRPSTNVDADEELKTLEKTYCAALTRERSVRKKILNIHRDIDKGEKKLEQLQAQAAAVAEKRAEAEEIWGKLSKELYDQDQKIERAERDIKCAKKTAKSHGASSHFIHLFDRDLDLRELEHRNMKVLTVLGDMSDGSDALGKRLKILLLEKGLTLPHHLKITRSAASWRSEFSDYTPTIDSRSSRSSRSTITIPDNVSIISLSFPE